MRLTELLFSFKGRIGRQYWWLTSLAVAFVVGMLNSLVEVAAKATGNGTIVPDTGEFEPSVPFLLVMLAIAIGNTWISYAVATKRLHDRARTGWWLVVQLALMIGAVGAAFLALAMPEAQRTPLYGAAIVLCVIAVVVSIWLFVELGFLKGTSGPNRFGPDPLARQDAEMLQ